MKAEARIYGGVTIPWAACLTFEAFGTRNSKQARIGWRWETKASREEETVNVSSSAQKRMGSSAIVTSWVSAPWNWIAQSEPGEEEHAMTPQTQTEGKDQLPQSQIMLASSV